MAPDLLEDIERGRHLVPDHLWGGLRRYLVDRVRPGRFLASLLRNDLAGTVLQADPESLAALRDLVLFLHNHAPGRSHGSEAAFERWLNPDQETAL